MKTFEQAINIRCANIDTITGQEGSQSEVYTRAIKLLGGLDAVIPFIPFSLDDIKYAIQTDKHFNNLPLEKWDIASGFMSGRQGSLRFIGGGIWRLYRNAGINSASCSQGVCLLKEAARQWANN